MKLFASVKKLGKLDLVILIFGIAVLITNLLIASYHLFIGDFFFHTDIARDLLLIEDLTKNSFFSLIGPRAGGIPGTFFGPLWLYMSLPFFIVGNGNPFSISIFWYLLVILSIAIVSLVTKSIFGWRAALVAAVIFSFYGVGFSMGFTQSFGSILLSPILFYLLYLFLRTRKFLHLIALLLINGLIIQFQPAFGGITMIITAILSSIIILLKIKKVSYFSAFFVLLIPASTYILFDIRHNFLQAKAILNFIFSSGSSSSEVSFLELVLNRATNFIHAIDVFRSPHIALGFVSLLIFSFIAYKAYKLKNKDQRLLFVLVFFVYYLAFWGGSFLFKGIVWEFYYLGFFPMIAIVFSSLYLLVNKKLFYSIFIAISLFLLQYSFGHLGFVKAFTMNDSSSWLANKAAAEYVFDEAKADFGYYVFSPDSFGYSAKYAINYLGKKHPDKHAELCVKKQETYLILYPVKSGDVNGHSFWKREALNIDSSAQSVRKFGEITVEKYLLTDAQQGVQFDPNIVCDLHFR